MSVQTAAQRDLEGNVERFKLPEIFQLLSHGRKSGTLGIQRDTDIVMVYFRDGQIVYAYGPRLHCHLGQLLKEKGRITGAQLSIAVSLQSESREGKRLGQVLTDLGLVDRADVMEVVRSQIEELLYSLLSWERGAFKFYDDQFPTVEEITVDISTENIILEGLRRLDEMNHLRDSLTDMAAPLALTQAGEGRRMDVSLSPEEWNILALVDGRRSIRDIVEISNLSEVETLKKLAALRLAGLLTPVELSEIAPTSAVEDRLERVTGRLIALLENYLRATGAASATGTASVIGVSGQIGAFSSETRRGVGGLALTEILSEDSDRVSGRGTERARMSGRTFPSGVDDLKVEISTLPIMSPAPQAPSVRTTGAVGPVGVEEKLWSDFSV